MQSWNFKQINNCLCYAVTLRLSLGLHARPAARLAQEMQSFNSVITVSCRGKNVDAKSTLDLLTLGAIEGCELQFYANGKESEACLIRIAELFSTEMRD